MRAVREIGDELYALPPADFTAARDGYIAEAKRDGEKAAAAELTAMKRPSQSAWLVNLLALRRPATVAELVTLGDTIRSAQGSVPPGQLRDLSGQRRKALDSALSAATKLAREAGQPAPTRAQLDDLEATLAAAMADDDAAEQVRSGRVVKPLRYSGFGDGFGLAAPATPSRSTRAAPAPAATKAESNPAVRTEAAAAAAEARRAAQERADDAERRLDAAESAERAANGEVDRINAEISALRDQLDGAQMLARQARQTRIAAEKEHESAQRRLARS